MQSTVGDRIVVVVAIQGGFQPVSEPLEIPIEEMLRMLLRFSGECDLVKDLPPTLDASSHACRKKLGERSVARDVSYKGSQEIVFSPID